MIHLRANADGLWRRCSSLGKYAAGMGDPAGQTGKACWAIIDPDGDRIRFTDGTAISMNQFGAMAYHFLHEVKGKRMVAKTVPLPIWLKIGRAFEKVFEPKVGFGSSPGSVRP